jgi:hypothetical protein
MVIAPDTPAAPQPQEAKNFKLLGHDRSAAWGGGSIVEVKNGHAYVGSVGNSSYNGPEGFTAHDVTDPRNPRKVFEFRAPPGIHMHKLRVVGDHFLYVNAEKIKGEKPEHPTGLFIFDISKPAEPRQVGFYEMPLGGPHRFGVDNERQLALLPANAEGWDERVIWVVDIKDPLKPQVISQWGLPQQKLVDGKSKLPKQLAEPEHVWMMHGPPVIRGNRMYGAFWGGGVAVIDCTDLSDMKLLGHVGWSPPFIGSTHTAWPLGDRPYLIVTDEARGRKKFWDSQFMWVIDIRDETNPLPVGTFFPDREKYYNREGRFGAHNILEYMPAEGPWKDLVFLTYFNAGLRAVNVSDPMRPKEVGYFVPELPADQKGIQSNDIGRDEHGRLYLIDRWGAGMHILEYTG